MVFDTCFLIDLQRELAGGRNRGTREFLRSRSPGFVHISLVTWMEFAEGYSEERQVDAQRFLAKFPLVIPDTKIAWRASRIARRLEARGERIGDHDIWIAATAIELAEPVVTRNARPFARIPDLDLLRYGQDTEAA